MNFSQLLSFPEHLTGAFSAIDDEVLVRRPRGGGFSLLEHAWHLADLEREGYGVRIMRLLAEENPTLPDFDGASIAARRAYLEKPIEPALSEFAIRRRQNVLRVRGLPVSMLRRSGHQLGAGRVTVSRVIEMMADHDETHAREIAALLGELELYAQRDSFDPWTQKRAGRGGAQAGA